MQTVLNNVLGGLQGITLLLGAPLLVGLLRWLKARLQLRQGPRIIQPYLDLYKLLKRPAIRTPDGTLISSFTPYVLIAIYGALVFMLPIFTHSTLLQGDFILVLYLLGLARFLISLTGLDAGAQFGGLGASRTMFFHFLTEISLGIWVIGLAVRWGDTDITAVLTQQGSLGLGGLLSEPQLVLFGMALICLVIMEAERLPIDNPATHLELTIAQRAVTLEYAGRDLAAIEWAEAIKLTFLLALIGQMFVPLPFLPNPLAEDAATIATVVAAGLGFALRTGLLLSCLALWEAFQPKRRLRNVPRIALTSMVLSIVAILYTVTFPK